MTAPIIGYAGMTHLGLNSAVAAADKGFELVCYDPDPLLIAALDRGELPVTEPDLPELLQKNAHPEWLWCEDIVTYDNPRIPQALILAGRWTGNEEMKIAAAQAIAQQNSPGKRSARTLLRARF